MTPTRTKTLVLAAALAVLQSGCLTTTLLNAIEGTSRSRNTLPQKAVAPSEVFAFRGKGTYYVEARYDGGGARYLAWKADPASECTWTPDGGLVDLPHLEAQWEQWPDPVVVALEGEEAPERGLAWNGEWLTQYDGGRRVRSVHLGWFPPPERKRRLAWALLPLAPPFRLVERVARATSGRSGAAWTPLNGVETRGARLGASGQRAARHTGPSMHQERPSQKKRWNLVPRSSPGSAN